MNVANFSLPLVIAFVLLLTSTSNAGSKVYTTGGKADLVTDPDVKERSLACIVNQTGRNIVFDFRWEPRDWKTHTLEPGEERVFSWVYENPEARVSPKLHVRWDRASHIAAWQESSAELEKLVATSNDCAVAQRYAFVGESWIQLIERPTP